MCLVAQTARCAYSTLHSMGANEHMQDAIQRSRSELNPAEDNPTDELESPDRGHKDQQQPEVTLRSYHALVSSDAR